MGISTSSKFGRRSLLIGAASSTVGALLLPYLNLAKQSATSSTGDLTKIRGAHFVYEPGMMMLGYYKPSDYRKKVVFEWDIANGRFEQFNTDVVTHVPEPHPIDANIFGLGSKRTNLISLLDWRKQTNIASLEAPENSYFYGHMAFSNDGRHAVTSMKKKGELTELVVLSIPSMKIVHRSSIPSGVAHEIVNQGNDTFLFGVANGYSRGLSFGAFDLATGLTRYYPTDLNVPGAELHLLHVTKCGDRYVANVNRATDSGPLESALVSFNPHTLEAKTEVSLGSYGLMTEIQSIQFDPATHRAWLTLPFQNEICILDVRTATIVGRISLPEGTRPTGVSILPSLETVIITASKRFFAYDSVTFKSKLAIEDKAPHQLLVDGFTAHTRLG